MDICEDCINKDVCKYREYVERYESKLPEPLISGIQCKYKRLWWGDDITYTPPSSTFPTDSRWTIL